MAPAWGKEQEVARVRDRVKLPPMYRLKVPPPPHRRRGSDGDDRSSGRLSAEVRPLGGGDDAAGGDGPGDPGSAGPRRGGEADRARARRGPQDGEAVAATRTVAAPAEPAAAEP